VTDKSKAPFVISDGTVSATHVVGPDKEITAIGRSPVVP
jgi:hypothetical protein